MTTALVTGGAGFIGSAVVRRLVQDPSLTVVNVDKLTYAGNLESLGDCLHHRNHVHLPADIADVAAMARLFAEYQPDFVMNLAAESHVDRSIDGPAAFVTTNVVGTFTLLEAARAYWSGLTGERRDRFRFLHVSTDEVFGSLDSTGRFTEESRYRPSSPYAASKAAADHFVLAWHHTFGLPAIVSNCSNNFGPFQYPEKFIPVIILNALEGEALPVYGAGDQVRDWLYVEDHVSALCTIVSCGRVGETYNVGGDNERSNLEVVKLICALLDEMVPERRRQVAKFGDLIAHVDDRPGHDKRYAIDATKCQREFGWAPEFGFESALRTTIEWYLTNDHWCRRIHERGGKRQRLGLGGGQAS